jgi:ADP-ribosylglycohydrolase
MPSGLSPVAHDDRLAGVLLGVALGDALGLATEGMSARTIARRFGRVDRFHMLSRTGFVSDDTEQSALIAQSLAKHPGDVEGCVLAFRRSMLGWFCRLPWGIGKATLLACLRIVIGLERSGVGSAGNGAAMRAAVIGVFFRDREDERLAFGRALAEVTHRDIRAIEGALYVAELAAACASSPSGAEPVSCLARASHVVTCPELGHAIDKARELACAGASLNEGVRSCGNSGFVLHSVALATFVFLRLGRDPLGALVEIVCAGGDTDSNAAILGGWLGALHGEAALPAHLIERIHDGPFGPTHLRSLSECLAGLRVGSPTPVPRFSASAALVRNLALFPVVLGHGFRRLVPF